MKSIRLFIVLAILSIAKFAFADDLTWSGSYDQWKISLEQAEQRVRSVQRKSDARTVISLNNILAGAEESKPEINRLADALKGRAGDIDSATSHEKVAKDESESAKRDADRASQQEETKAQQLHDDMDRAGAQVKQLDDEDERLSTWNKKLDDWHIRIEAQRRPFQLPDEQAAFDAFNAQVDQHNAEVGLYNTALTAQKEKIAQYNTSRDQLIEIQKLITGDGKHVLELRDVEAKKEQEYVGVQEKLDQLTDLQSRETTRLLELLNPSLASLQGLLGAMDESSKPVITMFYGGTRYSAREDDASAQAVALTPTVQSDPAGRLQSRIFVLPPGGDAISPQAAANVIKRQLVAQMHADDLATEYKSISPEELNASHPHADEGLSSPVEAIADLPVATADITGEGIVYFSESDISRPLDPRSQITRQEYETALSARARLNDLLPRLQTQLGKLKADGEKTLDDQGEFEEIRAQAVHGALGDLLAILPVKGILNRLAANPGFAGTLTPENIRTAEKPTVGSEKLLEMVASKLPGGSQDRMQIEDIARIYKVYTSFALYVNDPKTAARPNWEGAGEVARFGVGLAGVFHAPVAVGAGIESFGERGVSRIIIRSAIEDLSASLKSNDDAERFITERIQRTQGFVQELDRTVDGYEAVSGPVHAAMSAQGEAP